MALTLRRLLDIIYASPMDQIKSMECQIYFKS